MARFAIFQVALLSVFLPMYTAGTLPGAEIFAASNNCSADSQPCGPAPSCCTPGTSCNFRRGIPICTTGRDPVISGFDLYSCTDPYLYRCDVFLGISGYCCPIGTSCRALLSDKIVHCIDALGTTALAFPSATTGLVPSATPVLGTNPSIAYSPPDAWTVSDSDANCTTSKSLHVTDTLNATVSFNFTGPSIMVRTVTSPNGGVFSVWLDGFNTTTNIDTSSQHGNYSLPLCYPLQFPPILVTPPGFETHTNHTLTLVYIGPSAASSDRTNISTVQFDSFAIPDPESPLRMTSGHNAYGRQNLRINLLCIFSALPLFIVL